MTTSPKDPIAELAKTLPPFLTKAELAELVHVTPLTVDRWIDAGKLQCIDVAIGRRVLIPRDSVIAILRLRTVTPQDTSTSSEEGCE